MELEQYTVVQAANCNVVPRPTATACLVSSRACHPSSFAYLHTFLLPFVIFSTKFGNLTYASLPNLVLTIFVVRQLTPLESNSA